MGTQCKELYSLYIFKYDYCYILFDQGSLKHIKLLHKMQGIHAWLYEDEGCTWILFEFVLYVHVI